MPAMLARVTFERTAAGLEATLRPTGFGRYASASFLAVWLCIWAIGEAFAGAMLVAGAWSLLAGSPPEADALELVPALAVGAFLLLWLSFWTLGGYLAARELLRSLAAEDRIVVRPDGIMVHHRLGPFRSTTSIPRSGLFRVYSIARGHRLMAETASGSVELSSLPLVGDLAGAVDSIRRETGLVAGESPRSLPEGWTEVPDPAGGVVLVWNLAHRPSQARVAWTITAVVGLLTLLVVEASQLHSARATPAQFLAAFTAWLAWGSWRLSSSRLEWKLEPGRIRYRRRWGRRAEEIFEGTSIELVVSSDSDGDAWFELVASTDAPRPFDWRRPLSSWRRRRTIEREMDDPTNVRRLAGVIAARTGLRLQERSAR